MYFYNNKGFSKIIMLLNHLRHFRTYKFGVKIKTITKGIVMVCVISFMIGYKESNCSSLAPIEVEILCGLVFSSQRLQRIAGPLFLKKPILCAPKNQLEAKFL